MREELIGQYYSMVEEVVDTIVDEVVDTIVEAIALSVVDKEVVDTIVKAIALSVEDQLGEGTDPKDLVIRVDQDQRKHINDVVERLANLAEAHYGVSTELIEVRGSIEKTSSPRGKKPQIVIAVMDTVENRVRLARMDPYVTVRGLALEIQTHIDAGADGADEHPGQTDIEDMAPDDVQAQSTEGQAYMEGFEAAEDVENPYYKSLKSLVLGGRRFYGAEGEGEEVLAQHPLCRPWNNGHAAQLEGTAWQLDRTYPGDVCAQGAAAAEAGYVIESNPHDEEAEECELWQAGYEQWWRENPNADVPTPENAEEPALV